eukprot:m.627458 g.627458  ORF g.627458 m.627458 type:complete len:397 (-) comp22559_c0_seq3:109-1299(-)
MLASSSRAVHLSSDRIPALFKSLSANAGLETESKHLGGVVTNSLILGSSGASLKWHRSAGNDWHAQVHGSMVWLLAPPTSGYPKDSILKDACALAEAVVTGSASFSTSEIKTLVQQPGEVLFIPKAWYRAGCMAGKWNVRVGQRHVVTSMGHAPVGKLSDQQNSGAKNDPNNWFNGNLNEYYNKLEMQEQGKRRYDNVDSLAVHRWLQVEGGAHSTTEHYKLIYEAIGKTAAVATAPVRIMDAGCGLGAALMWMEKTEPTWEFQGYTISEVQLNTIRTKLPAHKFDVQLRSYNEPTGMFNAIYSIEAMIHAPNLDETLEAWSNHLKDNGAIVVIDDFLVNAADNDMLEGSGNNGLICYCLFFVVHSQERLCKYCTFLMLILNWPLRNSCNVDHTTL